MCMSVRMSVKMGTGGGEGATLIRPEALDHLGCCLMWVLGTELWSCIGTESASNL